MKRTFNKVVIYCFCVFSVFSEPSVLKSRGMPPLTHKLPMSNLDMKTTDQIRVKENSGEQTFPKRICATSMF